MRGRLPPAGGDLASGAKWTCSEFVCVSAVKLKPLKSLTLSELFMRVA